MSWRFLVALFALGCVLNVQAEPQVHSLYVPGADATRLAVDVWREASADGGQVEKVPAIVQFTRYWRSFRGASVNGGQAASVGRFFTNAGYAVVVVDVRGTGASFGARETEFSDAEIADFAAVFDWIVAQPWSNGRLATIGSSYLGNTAELAAITRHPALRAVVPRFSDFSEYPHAIRPGGVRNTVIAKWPGFVGALDRNDPCGAFVGTPGRDCVPDAPWIGGVRPVNGDDVLLAAAVVEHRDNANLDRLLADLVYSDDSFHRDGLKSVTLDSVSPSGRRARIDAARVPSYHWASWFDGGTAEGVLNRLALYDSPVKAIIGAWTHGGDAQADPFDGREGRAAIPDVQGQLLDIQRFLDPLLKTEQRPGWASTSELRYFVLGENSWRTTDKWPPAGVRSRRWHFSADGVLNDKSPRAGGVDRYDVDFTASTGVKNRWHTQLGAPVVYPNRVAHDQKLLTYTTAPMARPTEVTGTPIARVTLAPSQSDGALFVYLETVSPDGRVSYLSEGVLRLTFHGLIDERAAAQGRGSTRSFTRKEMRVVEPGRAIELALALHPISVLIPAGHRIRVAIAGGDLDSFERLPANGAPLSFLVHRRGSSVDLPMRNR